MYMLLIKLVAKMKTAWLSLIEFYLQTNNNTYLLVQ